MLLCLLLLLSQGIARKGRPPMEHAGHMLILSVCVEEIRNHLKGPSEFQGNKYNERKGRDLNIEPGSKTEEGRKVGAYRIKRT